MLIKPKEIEKKSFAIIGAYLRRFGMPRKKRAVVARVIHASADLAYARGLVFSPRAIEQGLAAINAGQDIIVDSTMVKAGISDLVRDRFSCRVVCLLKDKGVAATAQRAGITRCAAAMQKAGGIMHGAIVVVGNAPTALFEVCRLIKQGRVRPCLVIGLPVGFVGASQAKAALRHTDVAYITNRGRRGGSNVACAALNALVRLL